LAILTFDQSLSLEFSHVLWYTHLVAHICIGNSNNNNNLCPGNTFSAIQTINQFNHQSASNRLVI
jgi:hypothetical protein